MKRIRERVKLGTLNRTAVLFGGKEEQMDELAELVAVLQTFNPEQMTRFLSEAQQIVDHWPDRASPCKSE